METMCCSLITPGLVDSPLKLRLLLRFYENPQLCTGAGRLSERLCENPWAIADALESLAEAMLLGRTARPEGVHYRLISDQECRTMLRGLADCFDDPQRRDELYERVRAADRERQFRAWLASEVGTVAELGRLVLEGLAAAP